MATTSDEGQGYALFETALGKCGIAWGPRGITAVQLPEARDSGTRERLALRAPKGSEAPLPDDVRHATEQIAALLRGEKAELDALRLDMEGLPAFHKRVYEAARKIPAGETLSYGALAERMGSPGSARPVGQALGKNPFAIVVPCHRVLAASGRVGGFSANGGVTTKLRILAAEQASQARGLFAGDGVFAFDTKLAVEHLRASDKKLARVIDRVPFAMKLDRAPSVFLALAEAIVYQQLTGKAAATIYARVRALFPKAHEGFTPEQLLRMRELGLRGAGLSGAKVAALKDLARKTVDGELPTLDEVATMENEAIIERLTTVRGIGRWTVEMMLMFRLGRPDVLPVDDYGIRKGFSVVFGGGELATREAVSARGERWKPYRTVASWYLWRATELAKRDADEP